MKLVYTLFLTKTDSLEDFANDDCMFLRLDNASEEDAAAVCQLADKFGFHVVAFLQTKKD